MWFDLHFGCRRSRWQGRFLAREGISNLSSWPSRPSDEMNSADIEKRGLSWSRRRKSLQYLVIQPFEYGSHCAFRELCSYCYVGDERACVSRRCAKSKSHGRKSDLKAEFRNHNELETYPSEGILASKNRWV